MLGSCRSLVIAIAVCCGTWPLPAGAQEDEDSPFRPGLVATYSTGSLSAARIDEVVAFDWQDAAPDPRLPAGEFAATWRGKLWTKSSGKHRLLCYALGDVKINLLGRTIIEGKATEPQWLVSDPIDLEFGRHELEITFRKSGPRAQLALFWSGPDFRLEPIPERALLHDRESSPSSQFERGRQLAAALRCAACHNDSAVAVTPAPVLDRLTGNIAEPWLVEWLSAHASDSMAKQSVRRMPDLSMTREEATAVAAWLLREPVVKAEQKAIEQKETEVTKGKKSGKKGKGDDEEKPKPSAAEGERLLLTRGCLACHRIGTLGESGLFGGGDLTLLATKRPTDFLVRWLENPAAINGSHRMPIFTFTADELKSLSLWAKEQAAKSNADTTSKQNKRQDLIRQGEKLVGSFRCANCHVTSRDKSDLTAAALTSLGNASNWSRSCGGEPERAKMRPGYRLPAEDQAALKAYYSQPRPGEEKLSPQARGRDLLVQLNCLACHQREGVDRTANSLPARLQDKLVAVAEAHDQLAPLVPAMTPPALNSVGDKLHDAVLVESISRQGPPHRPYLLVQMPKLALRAEQLAALTAYFTATDRIPRGVGVPPALQTTAGETPAPQLLAAGPRLVTTDGLACTSCHQIGSVPPAKAPINARGPNLSMTGKRIRREWFDRFCADPSRIVPRMEMPSVKVPIRGVLNEKIEDQLAAVWHILNTPGFEPPEPNPVRVLRLSGVPERNERPIVIHDVMKDGDKTYLFPLVIGLPNRHNILFDLETNRLAAWWLGDTARQRTKGKSWYWETGAKSIQLGSSTEKEPVLVVNGNIIFPESVGQFASEVSHWSSSPRMAVFDRKAHYPLKLKDGSKVVVDVQEIVSPLKEASSGESGFERELKFSSLPENSQVRMRIVSEAVAAASRWNAETAKLRLPGEESTIIHFSSDRPFHWTDDGTVLISTMTGFDSAWASLTMEYRTALPADQYITLPQEPVAVVASKLTVAPGFSGTRIPLPDDIMPSGMAWKADGTLVFTSLKGQVLDARDSDKDGLEDKVQVLIDGLATPYGIAVSRNGDDRLGIATKTGLTRLAFTERELSPVVSNDSSPWGRTDDYHDWTVGPVQGENGELFVALPCQQDQRGEAAAQYRGKILKLVPRMPTLDDPRRYDIEVISSGHRFPMGLARNREGELFVTDNQGNYNPFNELNHVRQGAHFGFINALEKEKGFKAPPLDEPAIDIPHPWTRSVNGICFLETPEPMRKAGKENVFGPLEGQLVGCEYDTRRLIRMSLQKVGDSYQGAAYPLSIPTDDVEKGLLGPIVCAVKPTTGELYVGEIRDSGWGAGNNIGQIVKIKIEPEKLPCGIAEVRATATGFTIDFFQPVDRAKASDAASYSISSYRRESTPAYGGPDLDRRTESIESALVDNSGKRVTLTLPELRAGHLYELKLKNLAPSGGVFHPDEAHYTLRKIPQ